MSAPKQVARRYARNLWFPNEPHHLIEIEQWELQSLRDQLRDALNHSARLEAKNRELRISVSELRGELYSRLSVDRRQAVLAARNAVRLAPKQT